MKNLLSQTQDGIQIAPDGGFTGFGKLGLKDGSTAADAPGTFTTFISSVIGIMTVVAIIWFVFLLISGAIAYMSSGGDKAAIEGARKKIVNGVIGLVLVIIAVFVVSLIGYLLGMPTILYFPLLLRTITG
jgi:hypothetical protein